MRLSTTTAVAAAAAATLTGHVAAFNVRSGSTGVVSPSLGAGGTAVAGSPHVIMSQSRHGNVNTISASKEIKRVSYMAMGWSNSILSSGSSSINVNRNYDGRRCSIRNSCRRENRGNMNFRYNTSYSARPTATPSPLPRFRSRSDSKSSSNSSSSGGSSTWRGRRGSGALSASSLSATSWRSCSRSSPAGPAGGFRRGARGAGTGIATSSAFAQRRGEGWSAGQLSMMTSGDDGGKGESARNRVLATVVYLLPMLDGLECGENVFRALPQLGGAVHGALAPFLAIWENVPFMPLVMFIILQISVRRQDTSRFIRFNIQQAILVDISTVVLGLLGTAVGGFIPEGEEFMTNFAFYCLIGMVAYSVAETAKGRVANQIPLISAAAEIQIGPS